MKKIIKKAIVFFCRNIFTIKDTKKFIQNLCGLLKIDMLELAHDANGIMKYSDMEISGEMYFLDKILKDFFNKSKVDLPIIFDVGANIGDYSIQLFDKFPHAQIYSFEPNPITFWNLNEKIKNFKNIKCFNLGFGSMSEDAYIYSYQDDKISQHASLFKDVLRDFHNVSDIVELKIKLSTIDEFCRLENIKKIDFLKVDTEGFELEVFKGSLQFLKQKKIDFIQFEFNEMNIISKVFLKDFYQLLDGYKLFRLNTRKLIPLNKYNPINEIFRFHNIIAIRDAILN